MAPAAVPGGTGTFSSPEAPGATECEPSSPFMPPIFQMSFSSDRLVNAYRFSTGMLTAAIPFEKLTSRLGNQTGL